MLDSYGASVCFHVSALETCLKISRILKSITFAGGSEGKISACNARDLGSIPGPGRSPGEEKGNPLKYSCLKNSMDRGP